MSNPQGLAIARRLIAEEAEKKSGFLDLGMLGLTEIPTELNDLTRLRGLNLGSYFVDHDGEGRQCANSIAPNSFSGIAWFATQLKELTNLSIAGTSVSDLTPLAEIQSLQTLHCSRTQVSDLTPLAQIQSLQTLHCSETQVSDLTPLAEIQSLQTLNCWGTQVSDLTPLAQIQSLQTLDCSYTQVSDLTPLAQIQSLQTLACRGTQVSDLTPLAEIQSLQTLNCWGTQVSDLTPLAQIQSLQTLFCGGTQVSDLTPLAANAALERLNASGCALVNLPAWLLTRDGLNLILHGTLIRGIPSEVLSTNEYSNCLPSLRDHSHDLEAGAEPVPDAKLIVIGNGRIGKTQICRRLRSEPYDESVPSTHGIIVTQAPLPMPGDEVQAVLNIWDFGGQDLYHGTHALFLKTRALFLVVWTPQSETTGEYEHDGMLFRNQPLTYWLDYVRSAAGKICPVIVTQNQCDTPNDEVPHPPVDEPSSFAYLQEIHYSAKEDRKRDTLNEALREAVRHLRGYEGIATIGKGRMEVRRQIQRWIDEDSHRPTSRRQHRTLTQEQFHKLCEKTGNVSSPGSLLEYLHNAGIVFYRRGLFHDQIVLDQSWALDAIYTVFHREKCFRPLQELGGRFTRKLLDGLVWQDYEVAEQELFLSMMQSCGICFEHRRANERTGVQAEYIAPDLLPEREHVADQLAGRWEVGKFDAERSWSYPFLHHGLIRTIISQVGRRAGPTAVYWKYGVWFYETTTRSRALLEQQMQDDQSGRIVIATQGGQAEALLDHISEWIEECNSHAGCPVQMHAPSQRFVHAEEMPANVYDEPSEPTKSLPLKFGDPPRSPDQRRACVSYAWKEEFGKDPKRAGKVDQFCEKVGAKGFEIIRDKTHLGLGERVSEFMRQIGRSDRVYIFLSDAYLRSPYCMYELLLVWQSSCDDPDQFVDRIRVYTMPETGIYTIPDRLKYAAFWKQQRDDIKRLIDDGGVDVLGPTDLRNWKHIQDFAHNVDEMLAHIADILLPQDFDDYIDQALEELGD